MQTKKSMISQIILISIIMLLINMSLSSFIELNLGTSLTNQMFYDIFLIILTGGLGLILAPKVSFPLWWKRDDKKPLVKQLIILVILSLTIIIPNTIIYYFSQDVITTISWLNFSNLKEPVSLAVRAGIQEEIIYRLFLFSLITYIALKITNSEKKSVALGIILSSLFFGIMHGGFYFAFICGGLLAYIFYKNGLIPAIIVHFLADVIPWVLLGTLWK